MLGFDPRVDRVAERGHALGDEMAGGEEGDLRRIQRDVQAVGGPSEEGLDPVGVGLERYPVSHVVRAGRDAGARDRGDEHRAHDARDPVLLGRGAGDADEGALRALRGGSEKGRVFAEGRHRVGNWPPRCAVDVRRAVAREWRRVTDWRVVRDVLGCNQIGVTNNLDLEHLFQTTEILKAIRRSDLWVDRFEKAKSKGILKPETDNHERKGAARVCSTRERC